MNKHTLLMPLLGGIALIGGLGAGVAGMASAQTPASTTNAVAATDTSAATADTSVTPAATPVTPTVTGATATGATARPQGHMPIGQDGNITAINGSSITMQEESDEGGATFSVDASNATVTNNGAAASLSSLAVGDKIFVNGAVSGSNVAATSVSLGHPGGHGGSDGQ